jgi:hypothetical protein
MCVIMAVTTATRSERATRSRTGAPVQRQQGPQPEEPDEQYNAALRGLLTNGDARVLLGLLVVGGLVLGLLYVLVGDESGPPPETAAACAAWQDFRAAADTMSDIERLERVAELDREHRDALPEPATFDGAHAELAEGGEHVENYARRVDASCAIDG